MEMEAVIRCGGLDAQEYMGPERLAYFRDRLIGLKMELMGKMARMKERIKTLRIHHADVLDRSVHSMDLEQEISTCERCGRILRQIDNALERIREGRFGYCEYTGLPIGLARLEALPFTSLSIEAVEELESGHC